MKKLTTFLCAALVLALGSTSLFADDNAQSQSDQTTPKHKSVAGGAGKGAVGGAAAGTVLGGHPIKGAEAGAAAGAGHRMWQNHKAKKQAKKQNEAQQ